MGLLHCLTFFTWHMAWTFMHFWVCPSNPCKSHVICGYYNLIEIQFTSASSSKRDRKPHPSPKQGSPHWPQDKLWAKKSGMLCDSFLSACHLDAADWAVQRLRKSLPHAPTHSHRSQDGIFPKLYLIKWWGLGGLGPKKSLKAESLGKPREIER